MKLYHFCRVSDLDSIAEVGLLPHMPATPIMSLGHEVVWLTSAETTAVTDTDIEHWPCIGQFEKDYVKQSCALGWMGRSSGFLDRMN